MDFDKDFALVIDGKKTTSKETMPVINPATAEPVAFVPRASQENLDAAVKAAKAALPGWSKRSWDERRDALHTLAGLLDEHIEHFAMLLTKEVGKPLKTLSEWEIGASAEFLRGYTDLRLTEVKEETADSTFIQRYTPLGVCAVIVPWNFPVFLMIMKIGPALVAGNTVVIKPAPTTPLTTLKFVELAQQVLPPGVMSVLSGGDELGPWVTSHPGFAKISFTGSSATGKLVLKSAAPRVVRTTLELGGNDAAVVLPDVDIDKVADELFWAMFRNTGQVCINAKRVYIHADIYDALRDKLVAMAQRTRIGNGLDTANYLGPLQNLMQYNRVKECIKECREQGLTVHEGGILGDDTSKGYFLPVHLVDNPPDDSRVVREEPFGPICPLLKWTDEEDVIRRANDSDYGLAASVWGKDIARAEAIASRLEAGTVWINQLSVLHPNIYFGGHKMSGLGGDGGHGGLLGWVNTHVVSARKSPL